MASQSGYRAALASTTCTALLARARPRQRESRPSTSCKSQPMRPLWRYPLPRRGVLPPHHAGCTRPYLPGRGSGDHVWLGCSFGARTSWCVAIVRVSVCSDSGFETELVGPEVVVAHVAELVVERLCGVVGALRRQLDACGSCLRSKRVGRFHERPRYAFSAR